jgi:hypothetical protein
MRAHSGMQGSGELAGAPAEGRGQVHPFAGPLGSIRKTVQEHKHKRWGFLIYRCDYTSDDAWTKFLSNVRHHMEAGLAVFKADDLRETLDITVKEDKATLDGATVDQVRDVFKNWVQSEEAKAENNNEPYAEFQFPRYTYCVHVDADALDSVVNRAPQPPEYDMYKIGYVNLVQLNHGEPREYQGPFRVKVAQTIMFHGNGGDVKSVKVPLSCIGPESYGNLYDLATYQRYWMYQREDGVSFA